MCKKIQVRRSIPRIENPLADFLSKFRIIFSFSFQYIHSLIQGRGGRRSMPRIENPLGRKSILKFFALNFQKKIIFFNNFQNLKVETRCTNPPGTNQRETMLLPNKV
jgi:hypothetical protein